MAFRFFRSAALVAALSIVPILLTGCGGGSKNNSDTVTVNTTGNGTLATVEIGPTASSFVTPTQTFVARWPAPQLPPPSFTASLHRYLEARGDASRVDSLQKIEAIPLGNNQWNIRRRDNFNLDQDGVYYLQLTSAGGQVQRSAYIVSGTRSEATSRDIPTGGNGSLNQVQVAPRPGSVFISRDTTFVVSWPDGAEAPSRVGIDLWRYEEARGGEARKVSKQSVDLNVVQDAKRYELKIRGNGNRLERGGVYFVELTAPGETTRDYAYIVENN